MSSADEGLDQIVLTGEGGGVSGSGRFDHGYSEVGGGGGIQRKESPDFRFPEVNISVYLSYGELMESGAIY